LQLPIAFGSFVFFHALYYFGAGVMLPIATSMMADISEIHELKHGVNKDGAYSAVFVFVTKCAMSTAMLISGFCLALIGFSDGKGVVQNTQVLTRLCAVTLMAGPLISVFSLPMIVKYRVNKQFIEELRHSGNAMPVINEK
jgi:glycoside/pentoside/hexuronide:cation symporter, GPH family